MSLASYGRALYYPYINFQDERWLKAAALYYDGLSRIVPTGVHTGDTDLVRILIDEDDFIRNVSPDAKDGAFSDDFVAFARSELSDPNRRSEITKHLGIPAKEAGSIFAIHTGKLFHDLAEKLDNMGLVTVSKDEWHDFELTTGVMYMTFLANSMAERRGLPIITDDPFFQPLIRGFQFNRRARVDKHDRGHALASLVIEAHIPDNLAAITGRQIIQFRRQHNDDRSRFLGAINQIAKDIPAVQDSDALRDCLQYHQHRVEDAVRDYRLALNGARIEIVTGLIGLSLPSWSTSLAQQHPNLGILSYAGGALIVAAAVVARGGMNYYKSKRMSPWSYVLSLERGMKSQTLVSMMLQGTTLI